MAERSKPTGDRVIALILSGEYDEHVVNIAKALEEREKSGAVRTRWGIRFDDLDITADNATVAVALLFETQAGIPWHRADPNRAMNERVAIITAYLIEEQGLTREEAFAKVKAKNAAELEDVVYEYVDTSPPKDDSQ